MNQNTITLQASRVDDFAPELEFTVAVTVAGCTAVGMVSDDIIEEGSVSTLLGT